MKEIFLYFLRLGCLGFGGPLAVVAQMQHEVVDDRKWIGKEEFIQTLALIKSMPGPLAFSMATYVGFRRGGFWGGMIAGWTFVLPAALMMIFLALAYDKFSAIAGVSSALSGMQAAALTLIVLSIRSLISGYESKWIFWLLLIAALGLTLGHVPEPVLILGFGFLAIALFRLKKSIFNGLSMELFWICFKAGAFVFGTGLAIVPLLEGDFVDRLQWINHHQFMDALAFGQMTPGPVLITVTFVGYKVAGIAGAILATIGVFLPSFIHMTTWFPKMVGWLSKQAWISKFILGALSAVVATLMFTTIKLCKANSTGQNLLMMVFILVSLKWKTPSWMLILLGAVVGVVAL